MAENSGKPNNELYELNELLAGVEPSEESVDDILAEYEGILTLEKPVETGTCDLNRYEGLSSVEMDVIQLLLHHKKLFVDEISEKTGLHPQQLTTALMMLEMKGMVKETGGNNYRIME